jgi:hypothetical protein
MRRQMMAIVMAAAMPAAIPVIGQAPGRTFQYDAQAGSDKAFVFDHRRTDAAEGNACEVSIVSAAFDRPARMMLTSRTKGTAPSLRLELENHSDKAIVSIDVAARVKVKDSVYQLDSVERDLRLHLGRGDGWQRLQLAESAVGFAGLTIAQVTYADGSVWRPESGHACGFANHGGTERVAK